MSDITIKREEIPDKLDAESKRLFAYRGVGMLMTESAAYIRELQSDVEIARALNNYHRGIANARMKDLDAVHEEKRRVAEQNVKLADRLRDLESAADRAKEEIASLKRELGSACIQCAECRDTIAALQHRVSELVTLQDQQLGTPCEKIRHEQEVAELKRERDEVVIARNKAVLDFTDIRLKRDRLALENDDLKRRIAELEGAEPEAEAKDVWRIRRPGIDETVDSLDGVLPRLANSILPVGTKVEISHEASRPKTRKVTFWCNVSPEPGWSGRQVYGYPTHAEADAEAGPRLGGRAIPVTIDVPVEGQMAEAYEGERAIVSYLPGHSGDGYGWGGGVILVIGHQSLFVGEGGESSKLAEEIARRWNAEHSKDPADGK